jgi:hypothetical protein
MQENSNESARDYRDRLFMLVRAIEGVNGGLRTGCCCSRPEGLRWYRLRSLVPVFAT